VVTVGHFNCSVVQVNELKSQVSSSKIFVSLNDSVGGSIGRMCLWRGG